MGMSAFLWDPNNPYKMHGSTKMNVASHARHSARNTYYTIESTRTRRKAEWDWIRDAVVYQHAPSKETIHIPCIKGNVIRLMLMPVSRGSRFCGRTEEEEKRCHVNRCAQDCALELWSEWSPCSMTCGTGKKTRSRQVQYCSQQIFQ